MAITKKCGGPINKNTADILFSIKEEASTAEQQVESLTEQVGTLTGQVESLSGIVSNAKVSVVFAVNESASVPSGTIVVSQSGQEDQTISFESTSGPEVLGNASVVCGQQFSFTLNIEGGAYDNVDESCFDLTTGELDFQLASVSGEAPTYTTTLHSAGRVSVYQV